MSGDRLASLERLRDVLAERIAADVDGRNTAALARQYRDTLREVDELRKGSKKGSLVDELAKRRSARGSTAAGRTPPDRRKKKSG